MNTASLPSGQVEERVRAEVRRLGIDPMREREVVRGLVNEAVNDHAAADPLHADEIAQDVYDAVAGFGPLQQYFDDPQVEEVWINSPGRVFVAREGLSELTSTMLNEADVRMLVERMLRWSGRRLDMANPFVDAMLPDGSRLHVVIPEITRRHWSVNIRRFVVRAQHVSDLVDRGTLSHEAAEFLDAAVVSGLNVLVAGGTQAGKTTLLNALLGCVSGRERIISCEEVFELSLQHPDWIAMQTRDASLEGGGEIPLRRLIKEALRMRPTRLVVGEVRQAEALDLLIAMNSGVPSMATLHANSAREAVTKLCTLPLLAGGNIGPEFVVPTVAGCVDIVIHAATDRHGRRQVREIAALSGRVENGTVELAEIYAHREGALTRCGGYPPHIERFQAHGFNLVDLLHGRGAA